MPGKLNIPLPALGLVVDRPGEYVDARAATATKNMEFNRAIIRKRIGTTALGSTLSERVQRVFELQVGSETRLFRVGLTKVQVLNKTTGVWGSVASAVLTGTETDPVSYAFPTLAGQKVAVYSNAVDNIRKCAISGNDSDLGGSPPKAKHMLAFGEYLLLANVIDGGNDYPSRVQWPDTGDPETWAAAYDNNAGSQDLLDDSDSITGLGMFGGYATVHKAKSIYLCQKVSTSGVFRFERRATGVGAASGSTICSLPSGEQIFLATDGLHLFNGVTAPPIDSPVNDELRESLNPAYLYKAQGVFVEELDEYWVCVALGSDTEPQTVYKYNWRTKQVYKDTRADLCAMGTYLNTTQDAWDDDSGIWDADTTRWDSTENLSLNPVVILGYSSGVTVNRTSNSNDDAGVAVEGSWDTKDFTAADLGSPDSDRMVRWKGLEMWAKGSGMKVYYSTDGGDTWTLASTLTLTSSYPADSAPLNVYFDAVASTLRLRFLNNTSEESFTVKKYQIEATLREARK